MTSDELALACRLSGLPLGALWQRYLEVGGSRPLPELALRLEGADWPAREDLYLSVAATEALQEQGLPSPAPPVVLELPQARRLVDGDTTPLRRTAAVVRARPQGGRLTALFERCARAREDAREVRARAQALLRASDAAARTVRGAR